MFFVVQAIDITMNMKLQDGSVNVTSFDLCSITDRKCQLAIDSGTSMMGGPSWFYRKLRDNLDIWSNCSNLHTLPDIGFLGHSLNGLGFDYNFTQQPGDAWFTTILMDVWHWTSLVVLLSYAGLNSIEPAYYQAAEIDGASRWAVFRYIELPKMKKVLTIAILLRFMDSFMIYTEPFVLTGGGPGNATAFLSIDLVKMALGQFDLGPAAAMSLIYFFIVLTVCWVFYNLMMKNEAQS